MSLEVNIDSEVLITLVQERPVLWDKTVDEYKDKRLTLESWKEVCRQMKEDFDSLPDKDRNDIGKMVMKKWANIRDNWMKCHKKINEEKKSGAGAKKIRKYLFYEELRFLQKIADHRVTFSNISENDDQSNTEALNAQTDAAIAIAETQNLPRAEKNICTKKKSKSKVGSNDLDEKMRKVIDASLEQNQTRMMSFFRGIAPTVETFSDEDIVTFQYEVMKIIKNITCKKQSSQHFTQQSESLFHELHSPRYELQTTAGPSSTTASWRNSDQYNQSYSTTHNSQQSTNINNSSVCEQIYPQTYTSPQSSCSNDTVYDFAT
ncbi:unnamed protein product [Acanthoscelides obtectus]|nr:unnamed protein product [Acanthoscelides obtectus]CAK1679611.1 hypothetical protein AOBTE_LOCUS32384 [Acanthoscelides obtectus]